MRGVSVLVSLLLLLMSACSAPIRNRQEEVENTADSEPLTTTIRPPPLLPPGNRHGILIWMCQNDDVFHIIDEVKQLDDFDVTNVANLTKEVYTRLIDYKPGRLWTVYSTIFTTRSTANLITEDGTTISPSICFVQFNENPQILVVADLAEVV